MATPTTKPDRRILIATAVAVGLSAFVAAAFTIANLLAADGSRITDAEHDRLLDSCLAEMPDGHKASCPGIVNRLVELAEQEGCGYAEAASFLGAAFEGDQSAIDGSARRSWEGPG